MPTKLHFIVFYKFQLMRINNYSKCHLGRERNIGEFDSTSIYLQPVFKKIVYVSENDCAYPTVDHIQVVSGVLAKEISIRIHKVRSPLSLGRKVVLLRRSQVQVQKEVMTYCRIEECLDILTFIWFCFTKLQWWRKFESEIIHYATTKSDFIFTRCPRNPKIKWAFNYEDIPELA